MRCKIPDIFWVSLWPNSGRLKRSLSPKPELYLGFHFQSKMLVQGDQQLSHEITKFCKSLTQKPKVVLGFHLTVKLGQSSTHTRQESKLVPNEARTTFLSQIATVPRSRLLGFYFYQSGSSEKVLWNSMNMERLLYQTYLQTQSDNILTHFSMEII